MKVFSITVDDSLYEIITKDSIAHNISKSEAVRIKLGEAYHASAKQEEKVVKKFDGFERKLIETIEEKFSKIETQNVRSLSYILSNHHLIKYIFGELIFADLEPEKISGEIRRIVSLSKSAALKTHPVDSLNSKENITSNIFPEHLS
jgi:hypothetical protein